jgi:hypothetical protein
VIAVSGPETIYFIRVQRTDCASTDCPAIETLGSIVPIISGWVVVDSAQSPATGKTIQTAEAVMEMAKKAEPPPPLDQRECWQPFHETLFSAAVPHRPLQQASDYG